MKFDIVRAWKDENYRQSLSDEERGMTPANPVGEVELADDSLQSIYGTGFGPGFSFPGGASGASGASEAASIHENFHSLAFRCNEALFSLTFTSGFSILNPVNAFCINNQN